MVANQGPPPQIENTYVNINDEMIPGDEAHISVLDRNFLYGDGVFDSMPVYEGKVILANRHIDRFYRSAKAVRIDLSSSKNELRDRIQLTLEKSKIQNGGVRLIASRGLGPAGVVNTEEVKGPTLVVIPQQMDKEHVAYGQGIPSKEKARIASTRTLPADTVDSRIKSCNYLPNALAERELVGTDADFAIMLDQDGYVSEAYDANIFVLDEYGTIKTPPTTQALSGITREVTLELADELGYDISTTKLTTYDLYTAEDVFMTSSGRGIASITEINGQQIGDDEPKEEVSQLAMMLYDYVQENEFLELNI